MIAFVVGFSVFSSAYAVGDVSDLPSALAERMAWRDKTCTRTLRMILEAYSPAKAA